MFFPQTIILITTFHSCIPPSPFSFPFSVLPLLLVYQQQFITRCIKTDINSHVKTGLENSLEGERCKSRQETESPFLPQTHHGKEPQHMERTWDRPGPVIAASISLSPCDPCLVDSVRCFLQVSLISLVPTVPSPLLFHICSHKLQEEVSLRVVLGANL